MRTQAGKMTLQTPLKELQLRHNKIKRLLKDVVYYQKEALEHKVTMENLEAKNAIESDLNKQKTLYNESVQMINDSQKRLHTDFDDFNSYLASFYGPEIQLLSKDENSDDPPATEKHKIKHELNLVKVTLNDAFKNHSFLSNCKCCFNEHNNSSLETVPDVDLSGDEL